MLCAPLDMCVCVCAGMKKKEVQAIVEDHLKDLVLKHFDPRKADRIFAEAGSVSDGQRSRIALLVCVWGGGGGGGSLIHIDTEMGGRIVIILSSSVLPHSTHAPCTVFLCDVWAHTTTATTSLL